MKKYILISLMIILSSFCFAQTDEDLEQSMEDAQNQLLQILDDEDGSMDSLDILQEDSDEYLQKNEEIEKAQEKVAQNKKQNETITCVSLGFNMPFTFSPQKKLFDNSAFPFGGSLGLLSSINKWSFKLNLNWDYFNENINNVISLTASIGRSPIHNYYFLIGYYFTVGFESAYDDSLFNIGASGTIAFKFIGKSRLYLNFDVLYRGSSEEMSPLALLSNSWKISPSIGFVFGY